MFFEVCLCENTLSDSKRSAGNYYCVCVIVEEQLFEFEVAREREQDLQLRTQM